MREILLAFILALIIGSIINGWPKPAAKPNTSEAPASTGGAAGALTGAPAETNTTAAADGRPHRDYPDFNSFPAVNQNNFPTLVLASEKPVFVLCYSPTNLGYERMIPLIAALAQENSNSVQITRFNVLENAELCQKYGIYSIPTYLVFNKGQLTAKVAGIVAKDKLEAMLKTAQQPSSY